MNASIPHPELWTLQVSLDTASMSYTLHAAGQPESLRWGTIALAGDDRPPLQALENAVYDHPLLLDDYGTVRLLVHSSLFVIVPPEVSDEQQLDDALTMAWGDDRGESVALSTVLPHCDARVVYRVDRGIADFLRRTFNMAPCYHHLYPLCEHYSALGNSGMSRMFLNLHGDSMDLVVFKLGQMMIANTYRFVGLDDAIYYALHTWDSLGMNRYSDEVQLTGDKALRDEVARKLRRYVSYVMPAIYPAAALRLSSDVMRAPLDLILLALCES